MEMLCRDILTPQEKLFLGNMAAHPGFAVLKKLMADACSKATAEVIKLNPTDDKYERKIAALQFTARAMNDFSASLIKSVQVHTDSFVEEEKQKQFDDQLHESALSQLGIPQRAQSN